MKRISLIEGWINKRKVKKGEILDENNQEKDDAHPTLDKDNTVVRKIVTEVRKG